MKTRSCVHNTEEIQSLFLAFQVSSTFSDSASHKIREVFKISGQKSKTWQRRCSVGKIETQRPGSVQMGVISLPHWWTYLSSARGGDSEAAGVRPSGVLTLLCYFWFSVSFVGDTRNRFSVVSTPVLWDVLWEFPLQGLALVAVISDIFQEQSLSLYTLQHNFP